MSTHNKTNIPPGTDASPTPRPLDPPQVPGYDVIEWNLDDIGYWHWLYHHNFS